MKVSITYFKEKGPKNTDHTLHLAYQRAREVNISHVIIPTTSGATAVKALKIMQNMNLVIVTHMSGFAQPGHNQLLPGHRKTLKEANVPILTASHVLSGVERGIRKKFDTIGPAILIGNTLKMLGQGVKVGVEITLMAADAGLIPMDQPILALGGTGRGIDTAMIIQPAHTNNVFDLYIQELICKPH